MKRKRKNDQSFDWTASVANVSLGLAVVFCFAGVSGSHTLAVIQQAIAGFTMTYLWPIVAFLCFLALLASDLRGQGQVLKARATWTSMLALVILSAGSFITVVMRY